MSTFKSRIESYTGTFNDSISLNVWLTEGARYVINLLPADVFEEFALRYDIQNDTNLSNIGRVLNVIRNNVNCKKVSVEQLLRASDNKSLYYASKLTPVYGYLNGNIVIKPDLNNNETAYCYLILYPTVKATDKEIYNFPNKFTESVILFAAIRVASKKAINSLYISEAITQFNAPIKPVINAVPPVWTNVGKYNFNLIQLGELANLPTYTKPTISLNTEPDPFVLPEDVIPPDVISLPSINYSDAIATSLNLVSVSLPDIALVYNPPTLSLSSIPGLNVGEIAYPTDLDGIFVLSISPPNTPTLSNIGYVEVTPEGINATNIDTLPNPPIYNPPSTTDYNLGNVNSYIATEEDLEKANSEINRLQVIIEKYGKDLYNSLNPFNGAIEVYKAQVQTLIEQARISQERLINIAKFSNDVKLQNKAKAMEAAIQNNLIALQAYQNEIAKYAQSVNAAVSERQTQIEEYKTKLNAISQKLQDAYAKYKLELEAAQIKRLTEIQKYSNDIQNSLNSFNATLSDYRNKLEVAIEQTKINAQIAIKSAELTTDVSKQNKIQKLAADISDYELKLKKYAQDLTRYQELVNSHISVYKINLDKWQISNQDKLAKYSADIQNELNKFNKELAVYQSSIQIAIENARLAQEKMLSEAKLATDVDMQNQIQKTANELAIYRFQLEKYLADVQMYGQELNTEVSRINTVIQKALSEYKAYMDLIPVLEARFKESLQGAA